MTLQERIEKEAVIRKLCGFWYITTDYQGWFGEAHIRVKKLDLDPNSVADQKTIDLHIDQQGLNIYMSEDEAYKAMTRLFSALK